MNFLNLFRWKNLLMIAVAQLLIKYSLLEPFGANTALDGFEITLLILATICIAGAGNVINDIYDIETDAVNKPDKVIVGKSISVATAYNLFIALNVIGVGLGFYLSSRIGKPAYFSIFVVISALLYMYASYLKRFLIIGNVAVSVLVALSILIVGLFELTPNISALNRDLQLTYFKIVLDYGLFAFAINLLREVAKDIEDIDGDYKAAMHTLPIAIGRERSINLLTVLNFLILFGITFYVISDLYKYPVMVGYFLLFIIGPLIYVSIKLFCAKAKKDATLISNLYKWIMFFGILSLLLYKYVLLKG
ncbi:geranylgeranylglycerol-phosphate geranylgeranyltransferase [Hyunsoonleella sp. SJ7]|uniref:Geranylgeranylglycerol-phosphate geranylgeranyltransferase n=1 Tax=Hyunsoonleella aquatilis TaxID=2762758 RepID=A0A923HCX9_9FLAO|nr:geranylgeranylglycerol-phosphate geranylgeranyltransferase [Hyunsoonleella aquatilis]MBC3759612.1 geranylgeranylglycerol-phosphate geranylgeranyltransferase [Hyunsoonleella aquatilis]